MKEYLVDNSVLSDFQNIKWEDFLYGVIGKINTTAQVQRENEQNPYFKLNYPDFSATTMTGTMTSEGAVSYSYIFRIVLPQSDVSNRLDLSADKSCVDIAQERGWTLLTNDDSLRKECKRRNIPVHGSVYILCLGIKRNLVSYEEAQSKFEEMKNWGSFLPKSDLSILCETVEFDE